MTDGASVLDLIQIADSAFPSGAYAQSFGLEGLYELGDVDLEAQMRFLLANGLARVELPVVRLAFSGLEEPQALDELMDVLLPVAEFRVGSRSIGKSFLRAVKGLQACDLEAEHHPVVFGAVLRHWHLDLDDGLHVYAFQVLRQQLSVAQRLGKIGQSAMQAMLHRLKPAVHASVQGSSSIEKDEIGGFAPWLDIAGMTHAHQFARLFLS
jgi:urease accessory protein